MAGNGDGSRGHELQVGYNQPTILTIVAAGGFTRARGRVAGGASCSGERREQATGAIRSRLFDCDARAADLSHLAGRTAEIPPSSIPNANRELSNVGGTILKRPRDTYAGTDWLPAPPKVKLKNTFKSRKGSRGKRKSVTWRDDQCAEVIPHDSDVAYNQPESIDAAGQSGELRRAVAGRSQLSATAPLTDIPFRSEGSVKNSNTAGTSSRTDQPGESSSWPKGPDPSLSAYERLFVEFFDRVRACMLTDASIHTEESRAKLHLTERDGLLWRDNLLYIPDDVALRQDLLYWHHDVPWCAHLGVEKTIKLVQRQFWWPRLAADIASYVTSCNKCQANKPDRRNRRPPMTALVLPDACWRQLGVDLIVDLPVTTVGEYNAICVFACHLSKMVRLVPCHTTLDTQGLVRLYFREIFPHYGMPSTIVSDRGPQWNSEFFSQLCDFVNIRLQLSTAYHPQSNGLVERFNEVVGAALRHFVSPDHRDWNESLPFIEFAMNDMYHPSTQSSAFRMNRITLPRNPFDAVMHRNDGGLELSSEVTTFMGTSKLSPGARTAVQAHEEFDWARRCVHLAKCRMKEYHDARGVVTHLYEVGQLVWLNVKNLSLRHLNRRHKLMPKYVGPMKVLQLIGRNAVVLDLPASLKVHPTVSVSLIKPYKARLGVAAPPVIVGGEEEWELEAVTSHNIVKSRSRAKLTLLEFRAQWKGSCEDSWHEFVDFEHSVPTVERYISSCTKQARLQIFKAMKPEELARLSLSLRKTAKAEMNDDSPLT